MYLISKPSFTKHSVWPARPPPTLEKVGRFRMVGGCTLTCIPAKEDTIVLGYHIPKRTTVVATTITGLEDAANPIYGWCSPSIISSTDSPSAAGRVAGNDRKQGNIAVKLSDRLVSLRTEKSARKVGFWAPGTGKDFIPERWLDAEGRFDQNAGPSAPFSLGQRGCFGKNLAVSEAAHFSSSAVGSLIGERINAGRLPSADAYATLRCSSFASS